MGAPQVTIETITVTRPLKVIAFTCCFITVILMTSACATSDWMQTDGWREGLFSQCVGHKGLTPVPFEDSRDGKSDPGCYRGRGTSYLKGAAALVVIGLLTDFFGTFLTALGLRSTDPNKKYKYYRVAIYALIVSVVCLLLAAIIYPVQFSKDFHDGNNRIYSFGFGYGATWGSIVFICASVVLLICDRESEEIYYKEKQVEEDEEEGGEE